MYRRHAYGTHRLEKDDYVDGVYDISGGHYLAVLADHIHPQQAVHAGTALAALAALATFSVCVTVGLQPLQHNRLVLQQPLHVHMFVYMHHVHINTCIYVS